MYEFKKSDNTNPDDNDPANPDNDPTNTGKVLKFRYDGGKGTDHSVVKFDGFKKVDFTTYTIYYIKQENRYPE